MRLEVVPNQLTNDLRRCQVLRRAKLLKGFFLTGSMSTVSRAVLFSMELPVA